LNAQILQLLVDAANKYGLDPNLVIAVATQESGGNPNAVSPVGAQGVMQLMPATAAQLGVTNPLDPSQNIDAGVRYLSQLMDQFDGNTQLALAAYNWGPGHVSKYGFSNWPAETTNYVSKILASIQSTIAPADGSTIVADATTADTSGDGTSDGNGTMEAVLTLGALGLVAFVIARMLGN